MSGDLSERLGIEVESVSPTLARGRLPVAGNTQPHGALHGGASAALAEHLASLAAQTHALASGAVAVGVELSISHLAQVISGQVTGEARSLHLGRTLATYAVSLHDDAGRQCAAARVTCLLRSPAGRRGSLGNPDEPGAPGG